MLSVYLDVEISEDQLEMFNPNPVDFLMGSIMQDKLVAEKKTENFQTPPQYCIWKHCQILPCNEQPVWYGTYQWIQPVVSVLDSIQDEKDRDKEEGKQKKKES